MDTTQPEQLSFLDLAREVLQREQKPLTAEEIWNIAEASGLTKRLGTTGKTPKATLGAQLYTQVKIPDGSFAKVASRPAKFILRDTLQSSPQLASVDQAASPTVVPEQKRYHERELHPLMVWFANQHFGAHCRTIKHEISVKKGPKHNEWLHPDIVAFSLMTHGWEPPVVNLAQASGSIAAKLYSFEMKIEIGFSTLREYFFQTVSNSSWAHEGYLVAVSIDEDQEFRDELARLSQGFGIGVIQLNLREPLDSEIILPARERDEIDWETVNRIAEVNEDFMKFITDVVNSVKINQESVQNFEPVPKDDDVARIARDLLK